MGDRKPRRARDERSAWEAIAEGPAVWEALGRSIKVERVARGWERKDLAERSGLSYPYLSEIETGKKRPSWDALRAIAEAMGLRASQLLESAETWPADAVHSEPHHQLRSEDPPVYRASSSSPRDSRAEILRELLEYLEQLPTDDLERLRGLARALRT